MSKIELAEKKAYTDVVGLMAALEVKNGAFVPNANNLRIANQIGNQLRSAMLNDEYVDALTVFASEFDRQLALNNQYFREFVESFTVPEFARELIATSKRDAIDLLIDGVDTLYAAPVKAVIEQSVMNNAGYSQTLDLLSNVTQGTPEQKTRLYRYSQLVARDTFAVSDRIYTHATASELGIEWYWYSAGLVGDSRDFCIERQNRYYHRLEIEKWGNGERTGSLSLPQGGTWHGRNPATNSSTIFSYLGGYNCIHSVLPTSFSVVPKSDLQRAIKLGFYKPTKYEIQSRNLKIK